MPIAAPILGSLITGGLGLLSGALTRRGNRRDWKMQNRYNDPSQQVSRLRRAGLSPGLMYSGSSAGASGMAGPIASTSYQLGGSVLAGAQADQAAVSAQSGREDVARKKMENSILAMDADFFSRPSGMFDYNGSGNELTNAQAMHFLAQEEKVNQNTVSQYQAQLSRTTNQAEQKRIYEAALQAHIRTRFDSEQLKIVTTNRQILDKLTDITFGLGPQVGNEFLRSFLQLGTAYLRVKLLSPKQ